MYRVYVITHVRVDIHYVCVYMSFWSLCFDLSICDGEKSLKIES